MSHIDIRLVQERVSAGNMFLRQSRVVVVPFTLVWSLLSLLLLLLIMDNSSTTAFTIRNRPNWSGRHDRQMMMVPSSPFPPRPSSSLSRLCPSAINTGKLLAPQQQTHWRQHQYQQPSRSAARTSSTSLFSTKFSSITSPILSVTALGSVVLVHELGHYVTARFFQIKVEEFSIGMGPKIFGFHALGNEFNIRAFPLGGYVRMAGERDKDDVDNDDHRENKVSTTTIEDTTNNNSTDDTINDESNWFDNRPWTQRAIVLSGGVIFNLVLSWSIYFGIIIKKGYLQEISLLKIARVASNLLTSYTTLVWKGYQELFISAFARIVSIFSSTSLPPINSGFPNIPVSDGAPGSGGSFVGPIRIISAASDVASNQGLVSLLWFMAHISINLGVVNALPIPGLDGGKLVGVLLEALPWWKPKAKANLERFVKFCEGTTVILLLGFLVKTVFADLRFLFA